MFHTIKHLHINTVTGYKLTLVGLLFLLLCYLVIQDISTTTTLTFQPQHENKLLTKNTTSPDHSPIIVKNKQKLWLINKQKTEFVATLPDIFESVTVTVHYQSPNPEYLVLEGNQQTTQARFDPSRIKVVEYLANESWNSSPVSFVNYVGIVYTNPLLPSLFPAFDQFGSTDVIKRLYNESSFFIVKTDQNTEYKHLSRDIAISSAAYIMIPTIQQLPIVDETEDEYILMLEDVPMYPLPKRGTPYTFSLKFVDYSDGLWASVNKIEITGTRNPSKISKYYTDFLELLPF